MKVALITVFILVQIGALSGCGQKGPLYREAPAQVDAEQKAVSETEKGRSR